VVPETIPAVDLLKEMQQKRSHIAIAVEEHGGMAGIVTMEDLVEELVGDIRDEYDVEEAETTRHRGGDLEVDGLLNLDDFEDETGVELPEGPYETVAGYIMAELGRLPAVGDAVDYERVRLVVRELEGRRVSRVLVTTAVPAPPGGGEAPPLPGPGEASGAPAGDSGGSPDGTGGPRVDQAS